MNTKLLHAFHSHIELYFDYSGWDYSSHLSAFGSVKQLFVVGIPGWLSPEVTEELCHEWRWNWLKNMNVASVRAWLSGHMSHTITTDYISAHEVSGRKFKGQFGPSWDVVAAPCNFEGEVPDNSSICLLTLISMLGLSTCIALNRISNTYHLHYVFPIVLPK